MSIGRILLLPSLTAIYVGKLMSFFQRFSTFSGRAPLDMSYFELQEADIQSISALGADNPSSSLPALYHLYLFQVRVIPGHRECFTSCTALLSSIIREKSDEGLEQPPRRPLPPLCSSRPIWPGLCIIPRHGSQGGALEIPILVSAGILFMMH